MATAIHHAATAAINVSFLVWDAQKASQIYMLLLFAALVYEVVMSQPQQFISYSWYKTLLNGLALN